MFAHFKENEMSNAIWLMFQRRQNATDLTKKKKKITTCMTHDRPEKICLPFQRKHTELPPTCSQDQHSTLYVSVQFFVEHFAYILP